MSVGLTIIQSKALQFIRDYKAANGGIAPTLDDLKEHLGMKSRSGAHRVVERLIARGSLRKLPRQARALEIVEREVELDSPHMQRYERLNAVVQRHCDALMGVDKLTEAAVDRIAICLLPTTTDDDAGRRLRQISSALANAAHEIAP